MRDALARFATKQLHRLVLSSSNQQLAPIVERQRCEGLLDFIVVLEYSRWLQNFLLQLVGISLFALRRCLEEEGRTRVLVVRAMEEEEVEAVDVDGSGPVLPPIFVLRDV
jgi:hypothetical protein